MKKATIANGMLNVGRFLFGVGDSLDVGLLICVVTWVEGGAEIVSGPFTVVGASAVFSIVDAVSMIGAGTGLGGRLSLGSFSKGAERASSSALGRVGAGDSGDDSGEGDEGESLFINDREFYSF
jgi:hypothetical protein